MICTVTNKDSNRVWLDNPVSTIEVQPDSIMLNSGDSACVNISLTNNKRNTIYKPWKFSNL